jgi:hypothetical protein
MRSLLFFFVLSVFTIFFTWPVSAIRDEELVSWLHSQWLTKYNALTAFRPTSHIARGEAAKFMVAFATLMDKPKIKSPSECQFSDISDYDPTLTEYIIASCEYGIFKGSNGKFFPKNSITKWEALAVVMRMVYGNIDLISETIYSYPRYRNYYENASRLAISNLDVMNHFSEEEQNYDFPVARITIAQWIYDVYDRHIRKLGIWYSYQTIYPLNKLFSLLDGQWWRWCDDVLKYRWDNHYECQSESNYNLIKDFIKLLQNKQYDTASTMMTQYSLLPGSYSSTHSALKFESFETWIIGIIVNYSPELTFEIVYITIDDANLYLYRLDEILMPNFHNGSVSYNRWSSKELEQVRSYPNYLTYYPKNPDHCLFEDSKQPDRFCVNNFVKSIMEWKWDDEIWLLDKIEVMKQKILKAEK